MDTKPATNYPKSAAARAKAAAAIPTAPASQPPAQKAEMGLWNQVKKDLPLSQAEKTAQAEQRKKEAEEQLRALAEEKAEEKARAAEQKQREEAAAATQGGDDASGEAGEGGEAAEDEAAEEEPTKPAAKKRPSRAKKTDPPAKRHAPAAPSTQARQHEDDPAATDGHQKLSAEQMRHLEHIYSMTDATSRAVSTLQTCAGALFGSMPHFGLMERMPQAAHDQMLLQYQQPMNGHPWGGGGGAQYGGPQRRPPPTQQIGWDGEADAEEEEVPKKGKKAAPKAKPPKEDKFAAKNILPGEVDAPETALTEEEAQKFIDRVYMESMKKIEGTGENTPLDTKIEKISSNIRGFLSNGGMTLSAYFGKERALLVSLAAYIRMVYPMVVANVDAPPNKGTSRAHILTRIVRERKTTLLDETPIGTLVKNGELTDVFVDAFANVLAYYHLFLTRSGVDPVPKTE
jgi:hypothetical protein